MAPPVVGPSSYGRDPPHRGDVVRSPWTTGRRGRPGPSANCGRAVGVRRRHGDRRGVHAGGRRALALPDRQAWQGRSWLDRRDGVRPGAARWASCDRAAMAATDQRGRSAASARPRDGGRRLGGLSRDDQADRGRSGGARASQVAPQQQPERRQPAEEHQDRPAGRRATASPRSRNASGVGVLMSVAVVLLIPQQVHEAELARGLAPSDRVVEQVRIHLPESCRQHGLLAHALMDHLLQQRDSVRINAIHLVEHQERGHLEVIARDGGPVI